MAFDRTSWPDGLRIRHATPDDDQGVFDSMASPAAVRGTLQLPFGSPLVWRDRIAKLEPPAILLVAEVPAPDGGGTFEVVANAGLLPCGPSLRRRHAMALGMSVRDDWQRRGVGRALLQVLTERADDWMNVLRIELTVFADNAPAIALYRAFGFAVEGTHRGFALRDGVFEDALSMARLHPNPPRWREPETAT